MVGRRATAVGHFFSALAPVATKWGVDWLENVDELVKMDEADAVGVEHA